MGSLSTSIKDKKTYLHIEELDVQLRVKDVFMRVRKDFTSNRIISELTIFPFIVQHFPCSKLWKVKIAKKKFFIFQYWTHLLIIYAIYETYALLIVN